MRPALAVQVCPPLRPILTGPTTVREGQPYSISWSNVLTSDSATSADFYTIERSPDPSFLIAVDRIRATRPAQSLPSAAPGSLVLYHRVFVSTSCPTASSFAPVISNVLAIRVSTDCQAPDYPGDLTVEPAEPPALATYVVSWDISGSLPGPGGGPTGLTYRVRRTSPYKTSESVSTSGSVSFTDSPGDYFYQVRAEADCGTVGPWSTAKKVTVGRSSLAALVLVSEPRPMALAAPTSFPSTSFVIRNGGTEPLNVTAVPRLDYLIVEPASFALAPNSSRAVNVTVGTLAPVTLHTAVDFVAATTALKVPIDLAIGTVLPSAVVAWSDSDVEVDAGGTAVLRSIVNPGATPAAFASTTNQPWLVIETLDGSAWDRVMGARETRVLRLRVDRTRRRAESGTEVAVVSLTTVGHPDEPQNVVVMDDGPALSIQEGPRPAPAGSRTRLLYAAMPNSADTFGVGRFTSDLWLTNLDAVTPIDVSIFFSKIGGDHSNISSRFDVRLAAGETRRYRNIIGKVLGNVDASCEVEIRSPSVTLSTTAIVNNTRLSALGGLGAKRALGTPLGTTTTVGQFGFEMRPTKPGEGVNVDDLTFVLSGLSHEARRRTNILLTETSGGETTVRIELFDERGIPLFKNGKPAQLDQVVPALSTVQILSSELFDPNVTYTDQALYAKVSFVSGTYTGSLGPVIGSVVPFATVIDNLTNDASLRVGTSPKSLDPTPASTSGSSTVASPGALSSIPFHGGPAALLFPAAHLIGAPLENGVKPFWRTRVSFTNVTDQPRNIELTFILSDGTVSPRIYGLGLSPGGTFVRNDILREAFGITESEAAYGSVAIRTDESPLTNTWKGVDVQSETYTTDPNGSGANVGQFSTGMEAFSYRHGYSSFQSNLGTVQIEGAESSSRYRTNLILQEVGGASANVAVSAYLPGSFVPIASVTALVPPFGYISKDLFRGYLGLDLSELTDVRVVVRQIDGDGVYMAFASKINLTTGDPANIFLRPATAGTGR
ncbi:MAG: hypothetical protein ABIT01_20400 [Thermoanaerobaculia bacterium]